jgi:hypothetical protein
MDEQSAIDRYCAAWNEPDRDRRLAMLADVTTAGMRYIDPGVTISGRDALSAHIDRIQLRYPDSVIVRTTQIDLHHGFARFGWKKVLSDGSSLAESIDVVEFDEDRAIKLIVGFFGPLKSVAPGEA